MLLGSPVLLLGWQAYVFLRFGEWQWLSLFDVLDMGENPPAFLQRLPTGWVGVDQIINWLLTECWAGFFPLILGAFALIEEKSIRARYQA
jgi:hypothetical protein